MQTLNSWLPLDLHSRTLFVLLTTRQTLDRAFNAAALWLPSWAGDGDAALLHVYDASCLTWPQMRKLLPMPTSKERASLI